MNGPRKSALGKIRIIGGHLRNSRLHVAESPQLRPTPERVRETLFNWLAPVIDGARCLDLCAGTGALGIEACSRGASRVRFVESDAGVAEALRANLARLRIEDGEVSILEAGTFLDGPVERCDLVFLDPPFALGLWTELSRRLESGGWLATNALIYVESPRAVVPDLPPNWYVHREGHAGEVRFALYRRSLPLS
ncbi:MAG: 16S rRNA (guanine(966)-N(2))-methyltransferase RsmD [Rhodanobacter sp.]